MTARTIGVLAVACLALSHPLAAPLERPVVLLEAGILEPPLAAVPMPDADVVSRLTLAASGTPFPATVIAASPDGLWRLDDPGVPTGGRKPVLAFAPWTALPFVVPGDPDPCRAPWRAVEIVR